MNSQRMEHGDSNEELHEAHGSHWAEPPDADDEKDSVRCPACGYSFITTTNGKYKLRTRILVFTQTGNTMGICPKCKTNLKVPVAFAFSECAKGRF